MPLKNLPCGCTLDSDFVFEEHLSDGPPFHRAIKEPPSPPPSGEAEEVGPVMGLDESGPESKPKKKKW